MKRDTGVFQRLSVRLGVAVALVTSVVFVFTVVNVARQEREILTRELTQRLLSKSRDFSLAASGPLLRHDPELGLHPLIVRALEETPDLMDLVVLDSKRVVQGHRDVAELGTTRDKVSGEQVLDIERLEGESVWLDDEGLVIERPIRHLDQTIGWLIMKASRDDIEATVRRAQRELILAGIVGTLLAIVAVSLLVSISLKPLAELRRGLQRIGSGDLRARVQVASRTELGMLASMVNSMAEGLENAQSELIQKERMDLELQLAHELQFMLLPEGVKPAPGYALETHYTPALEVGGDYYDAFPLGDEHVAIAIADVSGKGVPGLVIMSMLRTMLRTIASPDRDPVDVLVAANEMLRGSMKRGMFVTCQYGLLNARTHSLRYASAGHCAPILFGHGKPRFAPAQGKPIGLFPDAFFHESLVRHDLQLQPGEALLFYTDGLVEALNREGAQFGHEPVLESLRAWMADRTGSVVDMLADCVVAHRGRQQASDDLTMLSLERRAQNAPLPAEVFE